MGSLQAPKGSRLQSPDFSTSTVITVSTAATAGTKGAWTQVLASTSFDCDAIMVGIGWISTGRICLFDIGVGASGSESAIITDLPAESGSALTTNFYIYYLPANIAQGSRISARANISGTGTRNTAVWVQPLKHNFIAPFELQRTVSIGTASTPAMTNIDPGATANTKGAYTQLVASLASDIRAIQIVTGKTSTPATSTDWKVDFAIGASGSEQIIVPDYYVSQPTTTSFIPQPVVSPIIPMSIPAGTRVAARCASANITAGGRTLDVALMGYS